MTTDSCLVVSEVGRGAGGPLLRRRGSVLLLLLFLSMVVAMFASALFKLHYQSLHELGLRRDRQQAVQWARSGLNHALHRWTYNPAWSTDLNTVQQGQGYKLSFSALPYRSVNNLSNSAIAASTNYRGEPVPAQSADVVVEGYAGRAVVRVHALVQHGVQFQRSLGALGKVTLDGDCEVRGIRSFADPTEAGGGILSKYQLMASGDWAIDHTGTGTFQIGNTALLESLPQSGGLQAISSVLHAAAPSAIRENSNDTPLPEFDVAVLVSAHTSNLPPAGLSGGTLATTLVQDSRYVSSDLSVNGDLVFSSNGALYVDGDLTLNGGVMGEGAIYCTGEVHINGGSSSLITNQGNGAAIFAGGEVSLQGQSAVGYLNALAASHPAINARWVALRNKLAQIKAHLDAAIADPNVANPEAATLWGLNWEMSKKEVGVGHPEYNAGVTPGQNWINSIPSPNGTYADAGSDALLPALVDEIRASLGPAYAGDVRAQRIVHALEETHYYFRHNHDTTALAAGSAIVNNRLVGPATVSTVWDDSLLNSANWSFEHGVIEANPWGVEQPVQLRNFFAGLSAFYANHPMDFGWLGSSNFQGIVYSSGNVNISNQFNVTGLILSGGRVHLTGGSRLIYNEEYARQGGVSGPLRCVVACYPSGSPAAGDLALSMETPMTDNGDYQRDSQGSLLYQAYSIYYRHTGSGEIRWLRVALAAPTPLATPQLATALAAAISLPGTRTLVRGPVEFRMLDANGVATDVVTDPTRLQVVMLGVSGPGRLPFTFVVDPPG